MQNVVSVRRAELDDSDKLVEFNRNMARETEGRELDQQLLNAGVKTILGNPAHGFYQVAEIEGEVVGCLMVTTEWSDWRNAVFWWVQSIYVAPFHRRRGVLRALYKHVRTLASESEGVCGCRLYVERDNERAQEAYTRLGFTETPYLMYEDEFH